MIWWMAWALAQEPAAEESEASPPAPLAVPQAEPPVAREPGPEPEPTGLDMAEQILMSMPLEADPDDTPPPAAKWSLTPGSVRYLASLPPDLQVDAEGTTVGQGFNLHQRLRAGFETSIDSWTFGTEWDLFSGQVAGDVWDLENTTDERGRGELGAFALAGVQPRRLGLTGRPAGLVRVDLGLNVSDWGLGLVANGGIGEPRLFGRNDGADRVLRFAATMAPFRRPTSGGEGPAPPQPLYVTLAVDRVIADDLANWSQGDNAQQGVLSIRYQEAEKTLGTYMVYRGQVQPEGDDGFDLRTTRLFVGDVFGRLPVAVGDWTLTLATEAVGVTGWTNRSLTYNEAETMRIRAAGAAVHVSFAGPDEAITAFLRGGIASGDPNPDDGVRHNLNFDPNYNVGLAYFPEVKGNIEAATVAQLSDPNNAGQAPDGVESLATEGAFGSTVYIQPAVEVQPFDWIELRSGIMTAWASAPIAQPFYTFRAGGTPHNHLDEPTTGRYLATEFDWSIAVDIHDRWLVEPRIQVQGGHALLSSNLGGGRADLVTITARLGW